MPYFLRIYSYFRMTFSAVTTSWLFAGALVSVMFWSIWCGDSWKFGICHAFSCRIWLRGSIPAFCKPRYFLDEEPGLQDSQRRIWSEGSRIWFHSPKLASLARSQCPRGQIGSQTDTCVYLTDLLPRQVSLHFFQAFRTDCAPALWENQEAGLAFSCRCF